MADDEVITPEVDADTRNGLHKWLDSLLDEGVPVADLTHTFSVLRVSATTGKPFEQVLAKYQADLVMGDGDELVVASVLLAEEFGVEMGERPCG